jgi:hypothetical protein
MSWAIPITIAAALAGDPTCPFPIPPPEGAPPCPGDFSICDVARLETLEAPYSALCYNWTLLQVLVADAFAQCYIDSPRDPFSCMADVFGDFAPYYDRIFQNWNRAVMFADNLHVDCMERLCP